MKIETEKEFRKEKDFALAEKMAESTIEYIELSSILVAYGNKDGSLWRRCR